MVKKEVLLHFSGIENAEIWRRTTEREQDGPSTMAGTGATNLLLLGASCPPEAQLSLRRKPQAGNCLACSTAGSHKHGRPPPPPGREWVGVSLAGAAVNKLAEEWRWRVPLARCGGSCLICVISEIFLLPFVRYNSSEVKRREPCIVIYDKER